ncbi:unnamed protein product [Mytilus coruscus]|uniref:Uncharacterized protein n=1 Tax=Mytilus coruscus TaxID=42192 RepID=A0A6J8A9Z9_MYTCO|nr:unnamed protein product [Mytilus coruscus]
MERSICSFSSFSDKIQCGRNINIVPSEKCLPLNNCKDDIQKHLRLYHISLATVTWEYDLIKERAGFFDELLDSLIICLNHIFMIGKGWRRSRLCMAKEPLPHCSGKHKASNTSVSLDQSFCRQYSHLKETIFTTDDDMIENPISAHTTTELQLEIEEPVHILDEIEIDDQHCIEASCSDYGDNRQILSIVAHQVSYNELHALIPDLSRYKYGAARKHALSAGSGQKVPSTEITHEGITTEQINHFLDFIMSPAIITDITFGESNLKLSNGEIISVPKIILNSVRTRVVQQYFSYCEEDTFEKKGSLTCLSSYMRILHAIGPNWKIE